MSEFKPGQEVTWTEGRNAITGTVYEIVRNGGLVCSGQYKPNFYVMFGDGVRFEVSYLVKVANQHREPSLYWPSASQLKAVAAEPAPEPAKTLEEFCRDLAWKIKDEVYELCNERGEDVPDTINAYLMGEDVRVFLRRELAPLFGEGEK